jgi:hypothetical protein
MKWVYGNQGKVDGVYYVCVFVGVLEYVYLSASSLNLLLSLPQPLVLKDKNSVIVVVKRNMLFVYLFICCLTSYCICQQM